MAAICRFCGQEFANGQAVKAHLKGCAAYRDRSPENLLPVGNPSGKSVPNGTTAYSTGRAAGPTVSSEFDLVRQLENQVAAGRLRLTMREIDEAQAELDRRVAAKARERNREAEKETEASRRTVQEQDAERARAKRARWERERQEDARQRRRDRIQAIKQIVMGEPVPKRSGLPDLSARILRAIENALSDLPVDELPDEELAAIARDARDRIYRKAHVALDEAEAAKREAQMHAQQLAARKQRLIESGLAFAKRELAAVEDLGTIERLKIELRIECELQKITGEEAWSAIEDIIAEIFEAEGIETDEFHEGESS